MRMRGRIGKGKCHIPGHGHAHMDGAPKGYVCEVTAEMGTMTRADEKRLAEQEIEDDRVMMVPRTTRQCDRRDCTNDGTNELKLYSPKPHEPAYWCDEHYKEYLADVERVKGSR